MTTCTRRYRFCASHRLHSESLSETKNQETYGKCNNSYGHGHDYVLDVSVTGRLNATTGLIVRVADLDMFVTTEVLAGFAHRNLNSDVAEFEHLVPTTENIALVIADRLRRRWAEYFPYSSAHLSNIFIQETDRNSVEMVLPRPILLHTRETVESLESVIVNA